MPNRVKYIIPSSKYTKLINKYNNSKYIFPTLKHNAIGHKLKLIDRLARLYRYFSLGFSPSTDFSNDINVNIFISYNQKQKITKQ